MERILEGRGAREERLELEDAKGADGGNKSFGGVCAKMNREAAEAAY